MDKDWKETEAKGNEGMEYGIWGSRDEESWGHKAGSLRGEAGKESRDMALGRGIEGRVHLSSAM